MCVRERERERERENRGCVCVCLCVWYCRLHEDTIPQVLQQTLFSPCYSHVELICRPQSHTRGDKTASGFVERQLVLSQFFMKCLKLNNQKAPRLSERLRYFQHLESSIDFAPSTVTSN